MPITTLLLAFAGFMASPTTIVHVDAAAPLSWPHFAQQHLLKCSAALDATSLPVERQLQGQIFRLQGSQLQRVGEVPSQIVIGVLSAIKDVSPETRANVARAVEAFKRAQVDIIIANGDIALNEFDLEAAMTMLGETGVVTLVLIGNSEGRGAFNRAFVAAEARYPNMFNLNWVRHVDLGLIDLVSLPGYYNRPFIYQKSGCLYGDDDMNAIGRYVGELQKQGKNVVLVAHGPPKSRGKNAIDRAFEYGNVGDPGLLQMLTQQNVRFGIFGHILEAGGRASSDVRLGKPAKASRIYQSLYVNAGATSAMPLRMLDGRTAHGMAMIVTFTKKGAKYQSVKLH